MGGKDFGDRLATARKEKGFTQEELAFRLGVTPQAISKWERGNGYPDLELLYYLCEILDCSADFLLHRKVKKPGLTEGNDEQTAKQLLQKVLAEPLVVEAGDGFIEILTKEHSNQFPSIRALREDMAVNYGFLLPVLRIRDNSKLKKLEYRILSYDQLLYSETLDSVDGFSFQNICEKLELTVLEHFGKVVNRQMIQTLVDNIKEKYPAVIDRVIPEKIPLALLQTVLSEIIAKKKPIRNLVKIIESLEEEIENNKDAGKLSEIIIAKLF